MTKDNPQQDTLAELATNLGPEEVEWKCQTWNKNKSRPQALAVPYITARAVMQRLDDVVGPNHWKSEYRKEEFTVNGKTETTFLVGISIQCGRDDTGLPNWVTKWDTGQASKTEPIKGCFSDAFKRAAVHWGVGRSLYSLDPIWVPCTTYETRSGTQPKLTSTPSLPAWYLKGVEAPADVNVETGEIADTADDMDLIGTETGDDMNFNVPPATEVTHDRPTTLGPRARGWPTQCVRAPSRCSHRCKAVLTS